MGTPMGVIEPRDKELPKEPVVMGRNRSGTGKSSKDKKSVFGVLSGTSPEGVKLLTARTAHDKQQAASHFHALRSDPPHACRF